MFERFTPQARHVVVLAQEEAGLLGHHHIAPEHILLALAHPDAGLAARALNALGITQEAARRQVGEIVGRDEPGPQRGHIPFTPPAKKILELSLREAIALGHTSIGPEHILLGLVRADEGPATQALADLGTDPNRVRQQVIRLLQADRREAGPASAGGDAVRLMVRGKRSQLSELSGRLDSLEVRLSALEQRVGTGPDLGQLDREIDRVRRDKERAAQAQDFENAAALRDQERQLLDEKAARQQEWSMLPSLTDELARLRELLRRHGIDPRDDVA